MFIYWTKETNMFTKEFFKQQMTDYPTFDYVASTLEEFRYFQTDSKMSIKVTYTGGHFNSYEDGESLGSLTFVVTDGVDLRSVQTHYDVANWQLPTIHRRWLDILMAAYFVYDE